jgi:hypothetical protein
MAIRGSRTVLDLCDDNFADETHPNALRKHASATSVDNLIVVALLAPVKASEDALVFLVGKWPWMAVNPHPARLTYRPSSKYRQGMRQIRSNLL